jgi:hypothetical protein
MMFGLLYNKLAAAIAVSRPQDAGGGGVPTPGAPASAVPCAVQDEGPAETEGQGRLGSTSTVRVFLAADPGLKDRDRLAIYSADGVTLERTVILDGPALDASGQAAGGPLAFAGAFEVRGRVVR